MTDGFTMIPNELLDLVMRRDSLQPAERCVLLYLVRQTFGYNRADSSTFGSIGAITSATGYGRVSVINAIKGLIASGLVVRPHHGGPGKGASVYAIASTVGCTSTAQCSTASYTTPSTVGYTTPSTVGCTLKDTKNKQGRNNPPKPPQGGKTWTADKLYFQLGGRGTIPPFVQGKWLSISERSDEDLEAALARVTNFANPRARFLEQFDDEGKDVSPGWASNGHTSTEKTWTAESLWAEMQAEDAAKAAKEVAECKA